MKEKTKQNLREYTELFIALFLSGVAVYLTTTCTGRHDNKDKDKKVEKTAAVAHKDSVSANNARLNMINLHNIKSR